MIDERLKSLVGKHANVTVNTTTRNVGGADREYKQYFLDVNDPINAAVRACAADGVKCRLWLPDTRGTTDARGDRVNIKIASDDGGVTYKVTDVYIG